MDQNATVIILIIPLVNVLIFVNFEVLVVARVTFTLVVREALSSEGINIIKNDGDSRLKSDVRYFIEYSLMYEIPVPIRMATR